MEDDPFEPSRPKMFSPLSNFKPKLEDPDYMELVWENGQILTRSRRSNDHSGGSTQNPRMASLLDLYEVEYFDVFKNNTGDISHTNLIGDTHVVPVRENPSSETKSPPRSDGVLPGKSDDSTKENIKLLTLLKPQAVAVAADNKDEVLEDAEPKTEPGLPEHEVLGWSTEWRGTSLSSISSGISEDPICSLRRTCEDSEGSKYLSRNLNDESDDVGAQVPARRRKTTPSRKRSEDNLSERERRHRINKRMRALQTLLPHSNKDDKAELLEDAIVYTKNLQLQYCMMANGLVAQQMMLPLGHYSPVGLGIGTSQFVPPPVPGFPNQPGLMPMPCSSLFGPVEASPQQSVPPPPAPAAAPSSRQFERSAMMPSMYGSDHRSNQRTVDGPSASSQMPEFSQVKNEKSRKQ